MQLQWEYQVFVSSNLLSELGCFTQLLAARCLALVLDLVVVLVVLFLPVVLADQWRLLLRLRLLESIEPVATWLLDFIGCDILPNELALAATLTHS